MNGPFSSQSAEGILHPEETLVEAPEAQPSKVEIPFGLVDLAKATHRMPPAALQLGGEARST